MAKPLRVLIVEDSLPDAELLVCELRQGGYDPQYEVVGTAGAMNAALARQPWDVILAGYVLPGFGGPQALQLVQVRGLDIPFIIVSGAVSEERAVAVMKAGAADYVLKNNLTRLVPAIERELTDAAVRRERRRVQEEGDRLMERLRTANEQVVVSSVRLQEQAARTEAIVNAITEGVVVLGPAGEVEQMNPAAAELLGYPPEERDKPARERLAALRLETEDGRPIPLADTPLMRALRGETVRGVVAVMHRVADGRPVPVAVGAAPLPADGGAPQGAVVTFADIAALRGRQAAGVQGEPAG